VKQSRSAVDQRATITSLNFGQRVVGRQRQGAAKPGLCSCAGAFRFPATHSIGVLTQKLGTGVFRLLLARAVLFIPAATRKFSSQIQSIVPLSRQR
jgi:hypothetical protein